MQEADNKLIIPTTFIQQKINLARAARVMREADLAELYGVTTRHLQQAVQRNRDRFSEDFMFQLDTLQVNVAIMRTLVHLRPDRFEPGRLAAQN